MSKMSYTLGYGMNSIQDTVYSQYRIDIGWTLMAQNVEAWPYVTLKPHQTNKGS